MKRDIWAAGRTNEGIDWRQNSTIVVV